MLAGKLAAEVVVDRSVGNVGVPEKVIQQSIIDKASLAKPKDPTGVKGEGAIAFGGGYVLSKEAKELLKQSDPEQLIILG